MKWLMVYILIATTLSAQAQWGNVDWEQLPGNIPKYATLPASATMAFIYAQAGIPNVSEGLYVNVDGVFQFIGNGFTTADLSATADIGGVTRGTFAETTSTWRHNLEDGLALSDLYSQALTIGGSPFNFSIFEVPRPYKPGQTLSVIVQRSGQWRAGTGFVGFLQTETVGDVILQSDPIATIINPIIETLTIGVLQ